jgi:hypothetical protein
MNKVAFIHIPKVAGNSMEKVLEMKRHRHLRQIKKSINETGIISFGHNRYGKLLKNKFTKNFMADAFTFAFVRNPYDRMVSLYFYAKKVKKVGNISFKEFCHMAPTLRNIKQTQVFWIYPEINFVGRFENLQRDFDKLCNVIGVERRKLPKINSSIGRKSYKEYYTTKVKNMVYSQYREDFIKFGYK